MSSDSDSSGEGHDVGAGQSYAGVHRTSEGELVGQMAPHPEGADEEKS